MLGAGASLIQRCAARARTHAPSWSPSTSGWCISSLNLLNDHSEALDLSQESLRVFTVIRSAATRASALDLPDRRQPGAQPALVAAAHQAQQVSSISIQDHGDLPESVDHRRIGW